MLLTDIQTQNINSSRNEGKTNNVRKMLKKKTLQKRDLTHHETDIEGTNYKKLAKLLYQCWQLSTRHVKLYQCTQLSTSQADKSAAMHTT